MSPRLSHQFLVDATTFGGRAAGSTPGRHDHEVCAATLSFEFIHECRPSPMILKLPQSISRAFENKSVHRQLNSLAHGQGHRGVFRYPAFGLEQLVNRDIFEGATLQLH